MAAVGVPKVFGTIRCRRSGRASTWRQRGAYGADVAIDGHRHLVEELVAVAPAR